MNYIFLDVDGVLNSDQHFKEIYEKETGSILKSPKDNNEYYKLQLYLYSYFCNTRGPLNVPFDYECINNLAMLVNDTNSNIVLSSNWREYKKGVKMVKQILSFFDIEDRLIGKTESIPTSNRDREILGYLWTNNCEHFVILDDYLCTTFMDYTVWTDPFYGLTKKDVEKAKKILKKDNKFKRR